MSEQSTYFLQKAVDEVNRVTYRRAGSRVPPSSMTRINGNNIRLIDGDGFKHDVGKSITFDSQVRLLRARPDLYEVLQEE